jgi:hypothetical protein
VSEVSFVDVHDGAVFASGAVGEVQTLVKTTSSGVWLVDADIHRVGTALSGFTDRRLHQRSPQPVSSPRGDDVQLGEVALHAAAPDRGTKSKDSQSGWAVPNDEDDSVATFDELPEPVCKLGRGGCGFFELRVEVEQQAPSGVHIFDAGNAHEGFAGSSHHGDRTKRTPLPADVAQGFGVSDLFHYRDPRSTRRKLTTIAPKPPTGHAPRQELRVCRADVFEVGRPRSRLS